MRNVHYIKRHNEIKLICTIIVIVILLSIAGCASRDDTISAKTQDNPIIIEADADIPAAGDTDNSETIRSLDDGLDDALSELDLVEG